MKTEYRPLPTQFSYDKFQFQMVCRQGDVALFAKWKPYNTTFHYEVVIIQKVKEKELFGKHLPAHEAMPSNEDWGTYGWSPSGWDRAWQKFCEKILATGVGTKRLWECDRSLRYRDGIPEDLRNASYPSLMGGEGRKAFWQQEA